MCQQAQHICWQKPSGELQCAGCTVACDGKFLWCVQEVAELKEEDIISGKLRTAAAAGVSGDLSRTLGELQCDERPMSMHAIRETSGTGDLPGCIG